MRGGATPSPALLFQRTPAPPPPAWGGRKVPHRRLYTNWRTEEMLCLKVLPPAPLLPPGERPHLLLRLRHPHWRSLVTYCRCFVTPPQCRSSRPERISRWARCCAGNVTSSTSHESPHPFPQIYKGEWIGPLHSQDSPHYHPRVTCLVGILPCMQGAAKSPAPSCLCRPGLPRNSDISTPPRARIAWVYWVIPNSGSR